MKKILFTLLFLVAFLAGFSQMTNNGGIITVENGATLVIEGDYTSTGAGVIEIDGNVNLKGDFINTSGSIHAGSTGTLNFVGTAAQEIGGVTPTGFYCAVVVNNAAGVALTGADAVLYSALTLTSGKLTLNAYDLTMAAVGITATSTNYVVTNDVAGELKGLVGASNVTFPVGSASTYNPLVLNNAGTSDTYGVRFTGAMPGGWAGTDHAVTGHWSVTEGVGTGSDLTVTTQWADAQEQASFDHTDCSVGVSPDAGATVTWAASGAATGTDPYNRAGAGFTSVGTFLVGDAFFLFITLDLDLVLAGPYNGTDMNTDLTVPLTDPYGLGTIVGSIPANTVDWIKIQLRDKTDNSIVLYERAYFLDNTGNVLNTDGAAGAKITGVPKDLYYVAVVHRNHFGVVSATTVNMAAATPAYNFESSQSQAWQDGAITTNAAMKEVSTGVFGLWEGDANGDGLVDYFGAGTDRAGIVAQLGATTLGIPVNGYFSTDVNMDGIVDYFGAGTDRSTIVAVLGATTLGIPISMHLP